MKCPNCSREITEDAVFCGFCGTPISMAVTNTVQENPAVVEPRDKKKKSKGRIVLRLLLLFLFLTAGGTLGYLAAVHEADIRSFFGDTRMVWSESNEAYTENDSTVNPAEDNEVLPEEQKASEKAPEE